MDDGSKLLSGETLVVTVHCKIGTNIRRIHPPNSFGVHLDLELRTLVLFASAQFAL
jgi:hypothetical protein